MTLSLSILFTPIHVLTIQLCILDKLCAHILQLLIIPTLFTVLGGTIMETIG